MGRSFAILLFWSASLPAEPVALIVQWSEQHSVVVTPEIQMVLKEEIKIAQSKVIADPMLAPKYKSAMVDAATLKYLNNLYRHNKSPKLLSLLVDEITQDGTARVYPSPFPKLKLTTSFEMMSVILNSIEVNFKGNRNVELWLNVGKNSIETRGGGSADCMYAINGERGETYERTCPSADESAKVVR